MSHTRTCDREGAHTHDAAEELDQHEHHDLEHHEHDDGHGHSHGLIDRSILSYTWILVGMLIGSAAGVVLARAIKMTAMPQMVGILNGFGGGASVLVATGSEAI